MYPFESRDDLSSRNRSRPDGAMIPESLSLEGTPPLKDVGREIAVILLICLGIALAGELYARLSPLL